MVLSAVLLVVALCAGALVVRGVRQRRKLERELAELRTQARVEPQSMLGNRQAFSEDLDIEVARADRTGRPASLLVLTLDPELWRDETGFTAPQAVGHVIRTSLRSVDAGYRTGTNEFAVLLPDTRALGALVAAGRLEERLGGAEGPARRITVGIAELGPGIDRHLLFRNAYCAMLAAGRDGHSRLLVYSPDLEPPGTVSGPVGLSETDTIDGPVG